MTEDIKVASSPYDLKYSTSVSSTSSSLKPSTAARSPHLPLYFPSLLPTAFTLPLPAFFERFAISLTVGQAFVLVMYATVVTLAIVWSSDTLRDPTRSGLIAAAQIPLVIALGTKNSVSRGGKEERREKGRASRLTLLFCLGDAGSLRSPREGEREVQLPPQVPRSHHLYRLYASCRSLSFVAFPPFPPRCVSRADLLITSLISLSPQVRCRQRLRQDDGETRHRHRSSRLPRSHSHLAFVDPGGASRPLPFPSTRPSSADSDFRLAQQIRRKAFQFFRVTHWFGMAILLVSLVCHPLCLS